MSQLFFVGVAGGSGLGRFSYRWCLIQNFRSRSVISSLSTSHQVAKLTPDYRKGNCVNLNYVRNTNFLSVSEFSIKLLLRPLSSDVKKSDSNKEVVPNTTELVPTERKSLWRRFVDELKHYWNGTKLLGYEVRISLHLVWRILQGNDLTRRERQQLVRTAGDVFRLVPFFVLVIIPFAEFAIPFLVRIFPNMLPSTFEEKDTKEKKLRKQLKAKLEMAKFLQDTLKESAEFNAAKATGDIPTVREFYTFLDKSRHRHSLPPIEEIVKFSKLFEDEITLDRMTHGQLQAMCRVLDLQTVGTSQILRFQLRMKLRELGADDKVIEREGLHMLNEQELQAACHARGMQSFGIPVDRLREQLSEWLDLHLNHNVPSSLLLFSRALYLPSDAQPGEQLTTAISQLPAAATEEAKVLLQEQLGEKVDPKDRLELLKGEMAEIEKEKIEEKSSEAEAAELLKEGKKGVVSDLPDLPTPASPQETLVDTAPNIGYTTPPSKRHTTEPPIDISVEDVDALESAIEALATERSMNIDAVHLKELRDDMTDLMVLLNKKKTKKEDGVVASSGEAAVVSPTKEKPSLTETRVSRYLQSRLDVILSRAEQVATQLDAADSPPQEREYIVHIDELLDTVKRLKNVSDEARLRRIITILDENNDGFISVNEVMKVIDLLDEENVDVKDKNLRDVIELIKKEDRIADGEKIG